MWFLWIIVIFTTLSLCLKYYKKTFGINKCSRHLVGKTVLITGGNTGIGFETARDLADRGAKVIIACRNEEKGARAKDAIKALTGNNDVHFYRLDLSSLKSVRDFVDDFKENEKSLDILINNAGDFDLDIKPTEDGLLLGMQVNYFGPFLLTNLLLPLLEQSNQSRIVNVASLAYQYGAINLDNLNEHEQGVLRSFKVYSRAKLCTVLSTIELSRRLSSFKVSVNACCPGFVNTNILSKVRNPIFSLLLKIRIYFLAKNAWEGAQTQIYLAVSKDVENVSGGYYTDCKRRKLTKIARDPEIAKNLWELSEKMVHLK